MWRSGQPKRCGGHCTCLWGERGACPRAHSSHPWASVTAVTTRGAKPWRYERTPPRPSMALQQPAHAGQAPRRPPVPRGVPTRFHPRQWRLHSMVFVSLGPSFNNFFWHIVNLQYLLFFLLRFSSSWFLLFFHVSMEAPLIFIMHKTSQFSPEINSDKSVHKIEN